jgi:hypothetical protein
MSIAETKRLTELEARVAALEEVISIIRSLPLGKKSQEKLDGILKTKSNGLRYDG